MSNLCQPQGVIHTLKLSEIPDSGFFSNEFIEDGQTVLANHMHLVGANNQNGEINLVINDGLLRTHQDEMTINVDNINGIDCSIFILMAIQPITQSHQLTDPNYAPLMARLEINAGETKQISIRKVDGSYISNLKFTAQYRK